MMGLRLNDSKKWRGQIWVGRECVRESCTTRKNKLLSLVSQAFPKEKLDGKDAAVDGGS